MSWRGFTYGVATGLVLGTVPLLIMAKIAAGGIMAAWMLNIVVGRITARSR